MQQAVLALRLLASRLPSIPAIVGQKVRENSPCRLLRLFRAKLPDVTFIPVNRSSSGNEDVPMG